MCGEFSADFVAGVVDEDAVFVLGGSEIHGKEGGCTDAFVCAAIPVDAGLYLVLLRELRVPVALARDLSKSIADNLQWSRHPRRN